MKRARVKLKARAKPKTIRRKSNVQQTNGAEKVDTNIVKSMVTKTIRVKLAIDEIAERAQNAADHQNTVDELTSELNGHKTRLKPQIKAAQEALHKLLAVIDSGFEERIESVEMVRDYHLGVVTYNFEGQEVEKHNFTDDDRQQTLPLPESAVGAKASDPDIDEVIVEESDPETKFDVVT